MQYSPLPNEKGGGRSFLKFTMETLGVYCDGEERIVKEEEVCSKKEAASLKHEVV